MAMYPQSVLDDIKDRISIVTFVGERIPLKKAGRNFKGLCPFHGEKTPSFMVSDEKQIFHCFGCGEGGNIFSFLMKYEGLSFPEAVEQLADRAGVTLPKITKEKKKEMDEGEKLKLWCYRLNRIVAEYFHENLKNGSCGETARKYLISRGIKVEIFTQHFLGYAEDSWDRLVNYMAAKNVPLKLAVDLGLVKMRGSGDGHYDFFRHRLIFPIVSVRGDVIGFSGRALPGGETVEGRDEPAKYINSPDSIIYHKSHSLYGLNIALPLIKRHDQAILVEGNVDVLSLHQAGFVNAAAPLGTALTSGHVRLLRRFTKNLVVVFDGDEAGIRAAQRSLPVFLEAGLVPKVVALPAGEDPDSFVQKNGAEALKKKIEDAPVLFEWLIDWMVNSCGQDAGGKVRVVEGLKPLLKQVANPVELAVYRRKLASMLHLDENIIAAAVGEDLRLARKRGDAKLPEIQVGEREAEKILVELMLQRTSLIPVVHGNLSVDDFQDEALKTIAGWLWSEYAAHSGTDEFHVGRAIDEMNDSEMKDQVMAFTLGEERYEEEDLEALVRECLCKVKSRQLDDRMRSVNTAIGIAEANHNEKEVLSLISQKQELINKLKNINETIKIRGV